MTPWQVNCKRMRSMAWTSVSRVGAVGCTAILSTCRSYADYRCFSLPPFFFFILPLIYSLLPSSSSSSPLPHIMLLPPFPLPLFLIIPASSSFAPSCSLGPPGGFGYTGMQSSSQSQFSYSLAQGSRARTNSSDVHEALYNLDRVLQGKCAAYKHECSGCEAAHDVALTPASLIV